MTKHGHRREFDAVEFELAKGRKLRQAEKEVRMDLRKQEVLSGAKVESEATELAELSCEHKRENSDGLRLADWPYRQLLHRESER